MMTAACGTVSAPGTADLRTRQRRDMGSIAKRPPKPPRLRGACNRCNSAKVKCNGDKTGCSRCLAAGVECVFANSLVGRVRGKRAKVNSNQSGMNASDSCSSSSINRGIEIDIGVVDDYLSQHSAIDPLLQLPSQPFPPLAIRTDWVASQHSHDINSCTTAGSEAINATNLFASSDIQNFGIMDQDLFWGNDLNGELLARPDDVDEEEDDDRARQSSSSGFTFSSVEDSSFSSPARPDFDPKRIQNYPVNQYPSNPTQPEISRPSSTLQQNLQLPFVDFNNEQLSTREVHPTLKKDPNADAKYVILCAELVSTLESYIAAHLAVLDIILEITHAVIERLNSMINLRHAPCSYRVLALLAVITSQVIDLLETGVGTLLAEDNSEEQHEESPISHKFGVSGGHYSSSVLLGLTLGVLQVDSRERRARKFQVVLRELGETEKFLKTVMRLAGEYASNSAGDNDGSPRVNKESCFADLSLRLKRLKEQVDVKRHQQKL